MSVQVKGSGTIGGLDEGLVVSGIVTSSTQINVGSNIKLGNAGVITATSFSGSISASTGTFSGEVTIPHYIVHAGDENTKFGFEGPDTITFETGGAEKLRIDSTGNIIVKGTGHEVRWLRDAGDRYGAIKYDGGQFSIMNPVNDNTQVTKSDGTLHTRFNNGGNLEIANGNLVISNAGSGIDFSATNDGSGTSNRSEVLDDYEEGSFTPIMSVEGQGSNASLSVARGLYNKVGSMVNIWIEVQFNGTPSGRSTSNAWQFGGLPFTSQLYNDSPSGLRDYRFPMIAMNLDTSSTYGSNGHFVFRLFDNNTYGRIEWQHSDLSLKNASLFIQDATMIQIHACYPDF